MLGWTEAVVLLAFCVSDHHLATPQVSALVDLDGTAANVTVVPLLAGLDSPNGVVWHQGSLYVAEIRRITRYDNVDAYALAGQVRRCEETSRNFCLGLSHCKCALSIGLLPVFG